MKCHHKEWLEDDEVIPTGAQCSAEATHLSCSPIINQPVCVQHKCRCNKLIPTATTMEATKPYSEEEIDQRREWARQDIEDGERPGARGRWLATIDLRDQRISELEDQLSEAQARLTYGKDWL